MLKDLLEIYRYSVITARNGKEALDILRNEDIPYLMLLDLMMPVLNGWEFLEAFKHEGRENADAFPIVVLSAADASDVEQRHGCRIMHNPLNLQGLAAMANEHCRVEKFFQSAQCLAGYPSRHPGFYCFAYQYSIQQSA
jgi:CheY-like chemotaxis protein